MIKPPNIFYTPVTSERQEVPHIADPRHLTDDEVFALNDYLSRRFGNRQMTPEVLGEIKAVMREAELDPDGFDYAFDEDSGALTVRPKPKCIKSVVVFIGESNKATNGVAGISGERESGRRCTLGKTDYVGCEHLCGKMCTGVYFPTYPPRYGKCMFLSDSN